MARTALRSVSDAIEATRSFLLPFSVGRFAKLVLVALFLGTPGTPLPASPQFADPTYWRYSSPGDAANGDVDPGTIGGVAVASPDAWPAWLLAAVGIGLFLVVAYGFLGVVMRFVLVETLGSDEVRIRRDAGRHLRGSLGVLAVRIVLWSLVFPVVVLAALSTAGVGPLDLGGVGTLALAALATVALVLAWAIEVLTLQFVVPTMIAADRGVLAGWRRFWPTLRSQPVEYALYGVVRVALGVAVGIAAGIGVAVVLALAGVVLGTIGAIVVVAAGGFGSIGPGSLAVLGLLVAIFALVGIVASAAVAVPFQCYLWIYALFVLGDTDPGLDLVPDLREATRGQGAALG
ncbi:hypothetical protein L593_04155 [Salinarchaeum sp. Harcht-Bsk1]|uniref:DUF7544 domain-containing protein n=1 Tax=Salinarchaeum sp. Harcht-Bsk1 TaxID=1333523 RepID=UPI0003424715|nr:hypothetical protein [Salinarchaeum sp. Harcht-Bsk1]AGN00782.1 hypothetical protein L593_04155 [Salinarchaeum sp. Harcht-Bsk1]